MFKPFSAYIKRIFGTGIGIIILLLMIININKQIKILLAAYKENREIRLKNEEIAGEIKIMERKIEEASSSAYLEKQARELFGLGGEDDYWLVLPDSKNIASDFFKINLDEEESNWKLWLGLFW